MTTYNPLVNTASPALRGQSDASVSSPTSRLFAQVRDMAAGMGLPGNTPGGIPGVPAGAQTVGQGAPAPGGMPGGVAPGSVASAPLQLGQPQTANQVPAPQGGGFINGAFGSGGSGFAMSPPALSGPPRSSAVGAFGRR